MKVAIYPGSFNPWHAGHADVLKKALKVFDKVIIAQGINPDKGGVSHIPHSPPSMETYGKYGFKVQNVKYSTLLVDFIDAHPELEISAVIKGIRDGKDLDYERVQQYWNEDLGLKVPTVYFVSDRTLVHISSSAIRAVERFK